MLRAYQIIFQIPINESPFNLVFGVEIVILFKIGLSMIRLEYYEEPSNSSYLKSNLDLLEETRNQAHLRMATYRQ